MLTRRSFLGVIGGATPALLAGQPHEAAAQQEAPGHPTCGRSPSRPGPSWPRT